MHATLIEYETDADIEVAWKFLEHAEAAWSLGVFNTMVEALAWLAEARKTAGFPPVEVECGPVDPAAHDEWVEWITYRCYLPPWA